MKTFLFLSALCTLVLSASDCSSKNDAKKYKGRLEIKGICMNYTIKLLEGSIDTSKIVVNWKDESSGKSHANVFALGDPCRFPESINEGDEFYFVIDSVAPKECIVCQAYYPTPPRSLIIKVLDK
jgi:hypothetical protein